MHDTVSIKVYRNDIACGEYRDITLDEFDLKIKELKDFADHIGKNVYFTVCNAVDCADFDCFAEVVYSGELSEQEKEKYTDIIKFFSKDGSIEGGSLNIYDLPISIIFIKAQIETL